MHTARHNFSHLVQDEKQANHELVTYGIYRIWRHPSYVGWFYWSIGTQVRKKVIFMKKEVSFLVCNFAACNWNRTETVALNRNIMELERLKLDREQPELEYI